MAVLAIETGRTMAGLADAVPVDAHRLRTGGSGRAERAIASVAGSRSPRTVSSRTVSSRCEKGVEVR